MNEEKYNGFIHLEHDLVRSEVWTGLSANTTRMLIGIWDQYNGHNKGYLPHGTEQAMRLLRLALTSCICWKRRSSGRRFQIFFNFCSGRKAVKRDRSLKFCFWLSATNRRIANYVGLSPSSGNTTR